MTARGEAPLWVRVSVLLAAVFAAAIGPANGAGLFGQPVGEWASRGDEVLRIAGYAFVIWAPLYFGVVAYGLRQLWAPGEDSLGGGVRFGATIAFLALGLWVIAAALGVGWATVVLIVLALATLLMPLWRRGLEVAAASGLDRWLVVWPLAALAGWLTAATPVNVITTATAEGLLQPPQTALAVAAVSGIVVAGMLVTARLRTLAYPLPIVWGLAGAFVAERARDPVVAYAAAAAAALLLAAAVFLVFRRRST